MNRYLDEAYIDWDEYQSFRKSSLRSARHEEIEDKHGVSQMPGLAIYYLCHEIDFVFIDKGRIIGEREVFEAINDNAEILEAEAYNRMSWYRIEKIDERNVLKLYMHLYDRLTNIRRNLVFNR